MRDASRANYPARSDFRGFTGSLTACGIKCRQTKCEAGKTTSISGTVFDPSGQLPLYNVIVYVPQEPLAPLVSGATCDKCGALASGIPLVSTLTDSKGHFVLEDMPVGNDVPVVIQVGKWRRQVTLQNVLPCQDNPVMDVNLTRLPKNAAEGDMPKIALVTGCDAMECFLRNVGIDDAEFTSPGGSGHVHVYQGTRGGTVATGSPDAGVLWGDKNAMMQYDMVILSCECAVHPETKPPQAVQAVHDYASAGGRLFAAHYHYYWFRDGGADFASVGMWRKDNTDFIGGAAPFDVDQSFPKGKALAEWLVAVGATPTQGQLAIGGVPYDIASIKPDAGQAWITTTVGTGDAGPAPTYLSFNTPVGTAADQQCGRVVFSDLHVSSNQDGKVFPVGCVTKELSAKEKALEFLFFDLSSCIQKDRDTPKPPK